MIGIRLKPVLLSPYVYLIDKNEGEELMKTIRLTYPHTLQDEKMPATVCAFGFFDGVHRGHQHVIQTAVDSAKEKQMESAVMTFHPHPKDVLQKQAEPMKYITPLPEKEAILRDLGVDRLYIVTFNHGLAALSPEQFIDHFIEQLHIKHVVGGFDYTFGHKGSGTMETMKRVANGRYETTIIPKCIDQNEKISSTAIRNYLRKGNIGQISRLLGRPFTVHGTVVSGEKRGRTIGFPTANIACQKDALIPAVGVYAVTVDVDHTIYYGMANIGYKPTFHHERKDVTLEVNIFDFDQDIYGKDVSVSFYFFIRKEKPFNGVDALIAQLNEDRATIQTFFSKK